MRILSNVKIGKGGGGGGGGYLGSLALAVALLMTAAANAEYTSITWQFDVVGTTTHQTANDAITLTATDNGSSVLFTFASDWTEGRNDGPGSVDNVFLYGFGDFFSTAGLTAGGGLNAGNGWWNDADYTVAVTPADPWNVNNGGNYLGSKLDGGFFMLSYADADATFEDFVDWLTAPDASLAFGAHFYNLQGDYSASAQSVTFGGPTIGTSAVPEPATLALMGLGLAGLGLARRRWK